MIGGGPAGSAAAATLARSGRSVLLAVDHDAGSRGLRIGEGAPPGLDRAVDGVFGPGTFVAADHLRSLGNRAAWGRPELVAMDFMWNPFGTGWHLDRAAFDASLRSAAEAAGATVGEAADDVEAPIVIDASGRRAAHARANGARLVTVDRLTAAVTVYATTGDDATTTVEAVEDGWWYTCPIPSGRRVVAFLTDGDLLAAELRTAVGFDRAARRTAHVGALLGDGRPTRPRLVAAASAHLERPVGPGWIASGDAAAAFDPLSSQGILTAVLMGREAATALDDPVGYEARYREIIERFEAERLATYRREHRWPESPFWSRRQARERE